MTTTVPKIFSFSEFAGVADAVADQVIRAQNQALNPPVLKEEDIIDREANSSSSNNNNNNNSNSNSNSNSKKKNVKTANKRFKIAISGGSLISVLSQGLLKSEEIQWAKWDIYFADERLVKFDDINSNYGNAKREIFDKLEELGKPMPQIFHINESLIDDAQECADDYEKTLIKNFANKDSVRLPLFDLFLLGCAPDGHIASIFPQDQEVLRENLAWCVPVENAPSGPSRRITLTIPVICHSHRVCFVVEGAVKASIVKVIMERPEKGLPASIVNEMAAGRVSWFVDKAALAETYL